MGMSERLELIARNVADIAATPWEVLGDGPARFLLIGWRMQASTSASASIARRSGVSISVSSR
jgi:hypothetical protein